jgi:hypothetical protein
MAVEETVDATRGPAVVPEELPPPATAAGKRERPTEAVYVLQIAEAVEPLEEGGPDLAWFDAAEVTVPVGTKRPTIIRKGLTEAGISPPIGGPPLRVRALDANSAAETPVEPDVQLKIGGAS